MAPEEIADAVFLVVGATDSEKFGSKVFRYLLDKRRNAVAINRTIQNGDNIHGTPAYQTITKFLERVEKLFNAQRRQETIKKAVVVFVIPPLSAFEVLREAHLLGINRFWFQPGSECAESIEYCHMHKLEESHGACIMK